MPRQTYDLSERCYLLELPGELRNTIIELYLRELHDFEPIRIRLQFLGETLIQPALALTNRQIRNETLSIFYGTYTFHLACLDLTPAWHFAQKWLKATARHLHLLNTVRLKICDMHGIFLHLYTFPGNPAHYTLTPSEQYRCRMTRKREKKQSSLVRMLKPKASANTSIFA